MRPFKEPFDPISFDSNDILCWCKYSLVNKRVPVTVMPYGIFDLVERVNGWKSKNKNADSISICKKLIPDKNREDWQ